MLNLKLFRHIAGLSQAQLANIVGCSQDYISRIERRKAIPENELLFKIARVLQKDPSLLFLEVEK